MWICATSKGKDGEDRKIGLPHLLRLFFDLSLDLPVGRRPVHQEEAPRRQVQHAFIYLQRAQESQSK